MSKRREPAPEFNLFIPALGDPSFRDQREVMERPFFSLQKRKLIEHRSPDGEAWVRAGSGDPRLWHGDDLGCRYPHLGGICA